MNKIIEDIIYNPPHYTRGRKFEPIDVIEDWGMDYHISTALAYLSRAGRKTENPIRDLRKAAWYINRRIAMLEDAESRQVEDLDESLSDMF